MRTHVTAALVVVVLTACAPPSAASTGCFEVPGVAVDALARGGGGWDANGRSLTGRSGGGWDLNSSDSAVSLNGVLLRDVASGSPVTLDAGWLVGADGARIDDATLVATGASGDEVTLRFRMAAVDGDVPLHDVAIDGEPACEGLAVLVAGAYAPDGDHVASGEPRVTVACERGVVAKCALWGYAPWVASDAVHQACARMARADYCGDGASWTQDGTPIDIADVDGIQIPSGSPAMIFEAGWDENGAVCVGETRYDVVGADGERAMPPCWSRLPRCADLTGAVTLGAHVMSFSLHTPIASCQ